MGGKLLEVDGSSIKFICEIKKQSTSSVHLSNISDDYVAFKVKTTSPKRFCVRPNAGIISPKSECSFTVTMQGLRSHPSEVECKDKFLIQSTAVDSGTKEEDITLDLFSKSSGKYVEEKKLRVVLVAKDDLPVDENKNKEMEKEASNQDSHKEHKHKVVEKEPSNESSHKEHKHKVLEKEVKEPSLEASHKEHKHKVLEKEASKEGTTKENKQKVLDKGPSNEPSHKEHKQKVVEKEVSNEALVKEHKHKEAEKEPSNEASIKEHKQNLKEKETSNDASIKEENLVKKDKDVSSIHSQNEDAKEVKSGLTREESKPSNDPDGNLSNNLKFNPVKIVKEDPKERFRLSNQLKELKFKESALENQLKEAKSTISTLTYQNSIIIEAKETLQLELNRRSKKGFSFVFVCGVSLIGLIGGYMSDP